MSKNEEQKVSRVKGKKRTWFKVIAPPLFSQRELGESFLSSADSAIGRTLDVNLRELTGNMKDQNASVRFRIIGAEKGFLHTVSIGYHISASSVRRAIKKNADRLDGYVKGATKDRQVVIMKTLFITWRKTQRSVQAALRKQTELFLKQELRKGDFSTFLGNIAAQRIQYALKKKLQTIYPLKEVSIRAVLLQEKGLAEEEPMDAMEEAVSSPQDTDTERTEEMAEAVDGSSSEEALQAEA